MLCVVGHQVIDLAVPDDDFHEAIRIAWSSSPGTVPMSWSNYRG
jgi:hypothetical protein